VREELFNISSVAITPLKIVWLVLIVVATRVIIKLLKAFIFKTLSKKTWFDEDWGKRLYRVLRWLIIFSGGYYLLTALGLTEVWQGILDTSLLNGQVSADGISSLGSEKSTRSGIQITLRGVITFIIVLALARVFIRLISDLLTKQLDHNRKLDEGQRFTIVKLARYALYVIGFLFAAQAAGVNLNALLVGSAALLVGLGLALQHIFDDIISGFIILFEGTFQVGDVIESDKLVARVLHIDIRTSKVEDRDGNIIVVPNRFLSSEKLYNWSHGSNLSRFHVMVGVSYSSDVDQIKKLLYKVALAHPDVSKNKPIVVRFDDFGDSALIFKVFFWAYRSWDIELLKSDLRFEIFRVFKEAGIEIPFPQRDLHLRSTAPKANYTSQANPLGFGPSEQSVDHG